MISKMITIKGNKVQNVGYRPFLLEKAVRLKIKNFDAINIDSEDEADNEKQILTVYISGEDKQITDFVEFVQSKKGRPRNAKIDSVVPDIYIEDVISIEEYKSILNAEQQSKTVQGGLLIGDILRNETNNSLGLLRNETAKNFEKMDEKYDATSIGMFTLVNEIKETNKSFEKRMEKTENNIEELLKILIEQKKQN